MNTDNINLLVDELTNDGIENENENMLSKLLAEWDLIISDETETMCYEILYSDYTVKELLKICKYYNIDGHVRATKCKKQDLITNIVYFENLPENAEIVEKRRLMWYYITELLKDSKMKQYIIFHL
jgi:hypothetical protein